MADCLFCKIAAREIEAGIVYEDERVVAFKDINPAAPVHLLIIPKQHIVNVSDLKQEDKDLVGHIHLVAKQLADRYDIESDGYRLVTNCGPGAGQSVFHLHFHLLGGRELGWPPG